MQNNDCICYDRDGNVIRVISGRKRTSPKKRKQAQLKSVHRLLQAKGGKL